MDTEKLILQFTWKSKASRIIKMILKKINKISENLLPDSKALGE
jgi:hypothetical protein